MSAGAVTLEPTESATPELLLDEPVDASVIEIDVHDASRIAWNVTVPITDGKSVPYTFELQLRIPANVLPTQDPWAQLQSYARLDTLQASGGAHGSAEALRRSVVAYAFKLARARDGFVRHCAIVRASMSTNCQARPLLMWLEAAVLTLGQARTELEARGTPEDGERTLADEYLSAQFWTVLTDCARALFETRRFGGDVPGASLEPLDGVERALADALDREIAYRLRVDFPLAQPANARQLERLLNRTRWLKKHFQRVLFLQGQSFQFAERLSTWFTAAAAVTAYLWFFFWQVLLEHRHRADPATLGSGVIAFAILTSIAYASREKLKDATRHWLAGRVQRLFAQRAVRYRLPGAGKKEGRLVLRALESFSQSTSEQPDPVQPGSGSTVQAMVLRFTHRGTVMPRPADEGLEAAQVRLIFRYDLSALFPRLHDAVKGFAVTDRDRGIVITDVPRNYEIPLTSRLHCRGRSSVREGTLVLNKNGLLRFELDGLVE